jgi:hypothetical protein
MEKYCRAGQATDERVAHARWMLNKISFRSSEINKSKKTLEDEAYRLSLNVGNDLPPYTA